MHASCHNQRQIYCPKGVYTVSTCSTVDTPGPCKCPHCPHVAPMVQSNICRDTTLTQHRQSSQKTRKFFGFINRGICWHVVIVCMTVFAVGGMLTWILVWFISPFFAHYCHFLANFCGKWMRWDNKGASHHLRMTMKLMQNERPDNVVDLEDISSYAQRKKGFRGLIFLIAMAICCFCCVPIATFLTFFYTLDLDPKKLKRWFNKPRNTRNLKM